MTNWNRTERPGKAAATAFALPDYYVNHAIMMPAAEALDIKAGIRKGIFNQETMITAVEQDYPTACDLCRSLDSLRVWWKVRNQTVETLEVARNVDYAYLDFCGWLTARRLDWIKNILLPKMTRTGSVLSVTLNQIIRHSSDWRFANPEMQRFTLLDAMPPGHTYETYRYRDTIPMEVIKIKLPNM